MLPEYDVIVVGGGHAGCEAAAAAAHLGSHTLLISMDMTKFAQMSCNPAMGGIAKGQIIREIDALGGMSGIVSDRTSIQFRMLNRSKGPAMWSPRAQIDRMRFSEEWRRILENTDGLDLWQDTVVRLLISEGVVKGVITRLGVEFRAKTVVLTNGTFLNGLMHVGRSKVEGGRMGESASYFISDQLAETGFKTGRLKTGTPVRIDGRSVNFELLEEQKGDTGGYKFSFLPDEKSSLKQRSCWITFTNKEVHQILKSGFDDSPMYNGTIQSTGPRYCPSIESKLVTFADKLQHQLFLEPEGEETREFYLNGFSSSLPWDVQYAALRKIKGLEQVRIYRPGYAIEYDYFDPTQLRATLETKLVHHLFFAGQINGTTGYEEAGAQGLMAGINAHLKAKGEKEEFILGRDEAYIGVLIDDLVTKGVDEPYRMFTSRAEYRILLRQDNADERLTRKGAALGLASPERVALLEGKLALRSEITGFLRNFSIKPEYAQSVLEKRETALLKQPVRLIELLLRPQISIVDLVEEITPFGAHVKRLGMGERSAEILESAEISVKYEGYINREKALADKLNRLEHIDIQRKFDYSTLQSLSTEARQKLTALQPATIGQASRIPGVSPADIQVLLILLGR